jgi:hypothetical protein
MKSEFPTEKPPKILIGICSARCHPERRKAVRETWLSHCRKEMDTFFFVGRGEKLKDEPDTLILDAPDNYEQLPEKVITFFRWALAYSDFEWLFKCDDDTYLACSRLKELLSLEADLIGDESLDSRGAPSGGAGYLLSRAAVERLCDDEQLPLVGAEDLIMGSAIVQYGLPVRSTSRLCYHCSHFPKENNDLITAHWCSPDQLRAIHAINFEEGENYAVAYELYRDSLLFFPSGYFSRHHEFDSGRWKKLPDGKMVLHWFEGKEETLIPERKDQINDEQLQYRCVETKRLPFP